MKIFRSPGAYTFVFENQNEEFLLILVKLLFETYDNQRLKEILAGVRETFPDFQPSPE